MRWRLDAGDGSDGESVGPGVARATNEGGGGRRRPMNGADGDIGANRIKLPPSGV
jgi:hypothetical protein